MTFIESTREHIQTLPSEKFTCYQLWQEMQEDWPQNRINDLSACLSNLQKQGFLRKVGMKTPAYEGEKARIEFAIVPSNDREKARFDYLESRPSKKISPFKKVQELEAKVQELETKESFENNRELTSEQIGEGIISKIHEMEITIQKMAGEISDLQHEGKLRLAEFHKNEEDYKKQIQSLNNRLTEANRLFEEKQQKKRMSGFTFGDLAKFKK